MGTTVIAACATAIVAAGSTAGTAAPATHGARASSAVVLPVAPTAYVAAKHHPKGGDGGGSGNGGRTYPDYTAYSSYPPFVNYPGCLAARPCADDQLNQWYRDDRKSYRVTGKTNANKILHDDMGADFSADYPVGPVPPAPAPARGK
jgi:hypothetical protein